MNKEFLLNFAKENYHIGNSPDVMEADSRILEFLFDNCDITVKSDAEFFVEVNADGIMQSIISLRSAAFRKKVAEEGLSRGENIYAHTGIFDFSHTDAGWSNIINLGIAGIKDKLFHYLTKETDTQKKRFYKCSYNVYCAAIRFMERTKNAALECGKTHMADGLDNLCKKAPANLFEAMQTMVIYYTMQQFFEGTILRSLGRVDNLLYPFYRNESEDLFVKFIKELDSFKATANMPITLCGSNENGDSACTPLSSIILNAYIKANTADTKLHILYTKDIPKEILHTAFDAIRNGHNSIVFMNDTQIIEALCRLGAQHQDAKKYHVVGCYECGAKEEMTCSCNARVNLPKALELTLNCGKDMLTNELIGYKNSGEFADYEALENEFLNQVEYLCKKAMRATDIYEENYRFLHSSPILSATYDSAMEKGKDIYCYSGAKYNNSSLNAVGIATVSDSLYAIKKLVFEDKLITLENLTEILRNNWEGNEILRLKAKNTLPKYGNAEQCVDSIAIKTVNRLYEIVSGKPNKKGGIYRLGLFSIDWRLTMGRFTAASADGRKKGEPISQNTGATFGAEKNGITAHLRSVASIDSLKAPNGHIVDIDLHSSAVKGEDGLTSFIATLTTYFNIGGYSVHYNVLDTNVLIKAKNNPDLYPNLQVRLCGWNVLFKTLSEKEKEEFILRSQK